MATEVVMAEGGGGEEGRHLYIDEAMGPRGAAAAFMGCVGGAGASLIEGRGC